MRALLFTACTAFVFSAAPVYAQKKLTQLKLQSTLDSLYTVEATLYQLWAVAQGDSARTRLERKLANTLERHQLRVQALTTTYGFPTYTMVGQATSRRFGALVLRYNRFPEFQQQVQQLMAKEVKKDNADDITYATLTDVLELRAGRPQVYGTQLAYQGTGLVVREPLLDPAKVNKRRTDIGLEPLEDYLKKQKNKHQPKHNIK
ncbi:hypothetical protein A8B98_06500 [Hymenobacter sp. UV11]|nr:hypothetical protein A8B98_06500 [Hymenobacter sp. UV11]